MNSSAAQSINRRRIKFIDERLQRNLLIALVMLEVLLVVIAVLYINHGFREIIESRLYSIHPAGSAAVSAETWLISKAVLGLLLANLLVLMLADTLWRRQTKQLLDELRASSARMHVLDLRDVGGGEPPADHQLLNLLNRWQAKERKIWSEVHQALLEIDPASPAESLNDQLMQMKRLLETRRSWKH